jgi:membrane protease YdiL (CAAX protease family)
MSGTVTFINRSKHTQVNPWFSDDSRLRPTWRFVLGVVVAVVANYIAVGVAVAIAHGRERLLEAVYRPLTMLLLLAGFALLLVTVDRVCEGVMRAMGLGRFSGWRRQALLGIAIGAGAVCLAVISIAVAGSLDVQIRLTSRTFELALLELVVLATGAMTEELMFRSYPFQRLLEAVGPAAATVFMSVLFALAHGANPHASKLAMFNTFAIGVLLCIGYLRTRALWLPWGIHFAWNMALGVVFGLPVSGLTDYAVIVRTRATGPRWATGGAYGIEGSLMGTAVMLLGFVPVILLTRRRAESKLEAAQASHSGESAPSSTTSSSDADPGNWDEPGATDQPSAPRIRL